MVTSPLAFIDSLAMPWSATRGIVKNVASAGGHTFQKHIERIDERDWIGLRGKGRWRPIGSESGLPNRTSCAYVTMPAFFIALKASTGTATKSDFSYE